MGAVTDAGVIVARSRHLLPSAGAGLIDDGAVAFSGGTVVAVGTHDDVARSHPGAETWSFGDHLILPGLVNAHDHGRGLGTLPMGVADQPLEVWIAGLFALRAVDPYLAALYDGLLQLASGVTTTTHQHNPLDWTALGHELDETARGYRDAGIRACIGVPLMDQNTLSYVGAEGFLKRLDPALAEEVSAAGLADPLPPYRDMIAAGQAVRASWQGDDDRWLCWGPVGPQWCSDALLAEVAEVAGSDPIHIHLVETRAQAEFGRRTYGDTPAAHLAAIGFLRSNVTGAHGVWLSDADIGLIAASGARVAHNASSNLRLRSGIAPVLKLRDAGVTVGIGLDGQTLGDDQDMWTEMRLVRGLAFTPGATGRALSARDILAMATTAGTAITGGPGPRRGVLEPGAAADFAAIRLGRVRGPYLDPRTDLVEAVLGRARPRDVDAVVVGGRKRIAAGKPTGADLAEVEARLAASLAPAKGDRQLHREALVSRLAGDLRALYADW